MHSRNLPIYKWIQALEPSIKTDRCRLAPYDHPRSTASAAQSICGLLLQHGLSLKQPSLRICQEPIREEPGKHKACFYKSSLLMLHTSGKLLYGLLVLLKLGQPLPLTMQEGAGQSDLLCNPQCGIPTAPINEKKCWDALPMGMT